MLILSDTRKASAGRAPFYDAHVWDGGESVVVDAQSFGPVATRRSRRSSCGPRFTMRRFGLPRAYPRFQKARCFLAPQRTMSWTRGATRRIGPMETCIRVEGPHCVATWSVCKKKRRYEACLYNTPYFWKSEDAAETHAGTQGRSGRHGVARGEKPKPVGNPPYAEDAEWPAVLLAKVVALAPARILRVVMRALITRDDDSATTSATFSVSGGPYSRYRCPGSLDRACAPAGCRSSGQAGRQRQVDAVRLGTATSLHRRRYWLQAPGAGVRARDLGGSGRCPPPCSRREWPSPHGRQPVKSSRTTGAR